MAAARQDAQAQESGAVEFRQEPRSRHGLRSWRRRMRANLLYLRRPLRQFLPVLAGMILLVLAGGVAFHAWYVAPDGARLTFTHALYHTYCLIFMEHLLPFPEHWVLQVFYFALPPLGLAVILDGIVRFSYHILRRDDSSGEWVRAMSLTMQNHVVLFGLGKLGLRVLQQLLHLGELVVAIEKDPNGANIAFARQNGVPVLVGNGREPDIFERVHLPAAKSIILATDDDLANLEIALDARRIKPDIRVVLRMFDQELAAKIKDAFDIQLAFSTTELAAPLFATASSDASIVNSFYVGQRLLVVAHVTVEPSSGLIGKSVSWLRSELHAITLETRRGDRVVPMPDLATPIAAGDELTVQAETAALRRVHTLNGPDR
ncbi:MAG: NAD-binding protein [Planctomycetota bacterium]